MKKRLKLYIPAVLASVMFTLLISLALWAPSKDFVVFYAELMTDPRYSMVALVVPLVVVFVILFEDWMKILGWRWANWTPFSHGMVAMPIAYKWLRLPFVALLAFCIPLLAWIEELLFRQLPNGWTWVLAILWGSLFFGVLHLIGLVPLRMVIYLSLLGAILVEIYISHGLAAAFVFHATYNYIVLAFIVMTVSLGVNNEKPLMARVKNGLARRS